MDKTPNIPHNSSPIVSPPLHNSSPTVSPLPGPVGEVVQPEERDSVGVDGQGDGEHADDVHHRARLHHVHGLQGAVTEDDGVGRRGYGEGEGVGAYDT